MMLLLQYAIRMIYVLIGLILFCQERLKRVWLIPVSICTFTGLLLFFDIHEIECPILLNTLLLGTCYCAVSSSIRQNRWKRICVLIFLIYFEELIYMVTDMLMNSIFTEVSTVTVGIVNGVVCICVVFLVSSVLFKRKQLMDNGKWMAILRKMMIPLVLLLAIEIVFVIISLDEISATSGNPNYDRISNVLSILSMLSIGILYVIVIYVKNANDKMEQLLMVKEQLQQVQVNYYETLLEKETATKQYRHDMKNHLLCLNRLSREEDWLATREYIEKMNTNMKDIEKKSFYTGIKVLDALLNYYQEQFGEDVFIQVIGKCKKSIKVSDFDLCTIFSNMIQNAVDAIAREQEQAPFFIVEITPGKEYVKIVMKNSYNKENVQIDKKGRLMTTKEDKNNHGMGIPNLTHAVNKNDGEVEFITQENCFTCKVILPIE